jgi:multicomponent Na+:H+ antiporter subunit D
LETVFSWVPFLAVLVSLVAVAFIAIPNQRPNMRESWTIIAALVKFGLVASMLPIILSGKSPAITLFTISPGISMALKVDLVGIIFALSASFLWILTSFYSIGYTRGANEKNLSRYFGSFAVCLSATIGIAFAANLFTLVIFYEILSMATYLLVIHKETPEAIAGGRKYLVYMIPGGVILVLALALTFFYAGTVDFAPGGILPAQLGNEHVVLLFMLFLLSFGIKSAVMPMHGWLPAAMVAPTPVSALLHAVAVVKAGVFGMLRAIGFIIGPITFGESGSAGVLAGLAASTIIISSLIALRQDNLKARLAYSTIGHLSYIILGLALISPIAWTGSILHIVNHAFMKITLFFCAGAIYVKTHKISVSELNGIGRQMPLTMGAFALASLGLAGIPPINGFISKWFLISGSFDTGQIIFVVVFLISGLLNAGYLFSIVARAFFMPSKTPNKYSEASPFMVVPLIITAALALYFGMFPENMPYFYELTVRAVDSIFSGGTP